MNDTSNNSKKERPIRRVLRRKRSQEYFTGSGWTENLEEARFFRDSLEAAQMCAHCGLSEVEMVLRVKGGTSDLYCTEFR
jgi:hypothetical protein